MNNQKFDHYFEIVIDIVYVSSIIGLIAFTVNSALSNI